MLYRLRRRLSDVEICIVCCVLNHIKEIGGRKVTCAVNAAHWVQLENIVSTVYCWNRVGSIQLGKFGGEEKIILRWL